MQVQVVSLRRGIMEEVVAQTNADEGGCAPWRSKGASLLNISAGETTPHRINHWQRETIRRGVGERWSSAERADMFRRNINKDQHLDGMTRHVGHKIFPRI
jgi:hypothetical protein